MRFGIDGGISIADQTFSNYPYSGAKSPLDGFVVGGIAEYDVSDPWAIEVEPRYIQDGIRVSQELYAGPSVVTHPDMKLELNYLEIPIHAKAKFDAGPFRPFVLAGGGVGFLLTAVADAGFNVQDRGSIFDVKSDYKSANFFADLGAGCEYQLRQNIALVGQFGYSRGISNINNVSGPSESTIKSSVIQILAGILYDI
jgi:opacity protein-like surface antigen